MSIRAYIGLGSNLDQPRAQVEQALQELNQLPQSRCLTHSHLYRSHAVGPGQQPDYINAAALLDTELEPHALLDQLQALEQAHRRVRLEHWGPRSLDLDLLLYGDRVIDSERLQVPHPYLRERNFVLMPLADLNPELILPSGEALTALLAQHSMQGLVRL